MTTCILKTPPGRGHLIFFTAVIYTAVKKINNSNNVISAADRMEALF